MSTAATLSQARDWAVDGSYAAGWRLVRALPEPAARAAFDRGADVAGRRNRRGVRQLRANLRRVVGPAVPEADLDAIVGAGLRSYARYWRETFRLPSMDRASVLARTSTSGAEHIDAGLAAGRGVILALPHSGNWDIAGVWLIDRGVPFTTVAERLRPESLFNRFVAYRESLGFEIVALHGGERTPTEVLRQRLQGGGCVCLLADRDLSRSGMEVDFFGEPARMPPGPALLAARTGAALLPVCVDFGSPEPQGWGQWIGTPLIAAPERLRDQVQDLTQQLADTFAGRIAGRPEDWHMLQKLWTADLSAPVSVLR
ncbi:MAG: phosphatidylinositol mannoside acyltransferase [bacterium]